MIPPAITGTLSKKFYLLQNEVDNRSRRLWVGTEALAAGPGGISVVSKVTGIPECTIRIGKKILRNAFQPKPPKGLHDESGEKGAGANRQQNSITLCLQLLTLS